MKKKLSFTIVGLCLIIVSVLASISISKRNSTQIDHPPHKLQEVTPNPVYTIVDTASSPKSTAAVTQDEIIREASFADSTRQQFLVKSAVDGSIREIFQVHESDITFEKIQPENWAPTNKFLFVYVDYSNRRDVIFLKTDGKFTNGNYYLHSTGLYPTMNVKKATWIDNVTLELQTTDTKTNLPQKYTVGFDDDTGIISPESNNK